eukprot:CAMPEP_0185911862 /NCGR_PEP_ID=MMETSP0196C-20130402/34275_1 /TAXON_ID=2932 /ORGANISM="Alexandrium fundyense, Strain CCMP1719" /LENGTH=54 /DNA_ID=CAMNT_0028632993 /DNA_START=43 /DNA_END=204 /DNA_ORIENTATION=+
MGTGASFAKVKQMPEAELKEVFEGYDEDKNGIDEMELGPMLEDLDLLNGTKEEN